MTVIHAGPLQALPANSSEELTTAFESWLQAAGWDGERLELRPSPTHETLGWKVCAVEGCGRPAWGVKNSRLCQGCDATWRRDGRPDRAQFDRQPPHRCRHLQVLPQCEVTRDGVRCARNAHGAGLCENHLYRVRTSPLSRDAALKCLTPLPPFGKCRVAACNRESDGRRWQLCRAHRTKWLSVRRAEPDTKFANWCQRTRQVNDARRVAFAGTHPTVTRQILHGVFTRSRRSAQTRLVELQRVVDFVRWLEPTDLSQILDAEPPANWSRGTRKLLKIILLTAECSHQSPEDFRHADVWPGLVFGRVATVDFRDLSQPWLREITQAWCWDNLNRFDHFKVFRDVVTEMCYFSEYLRSNVIGGGQKITALERSTLIGFATYIASLVKQGAPRARSKVKHPPSVWNRNLQHACLRALQRILRYGRETGRMEQFADSFMVTDDLIVKHTKARQCDDAGYALPIPVIRQLFAAESLAALGKINRDIPHVLRIAAETGRRPTEFLSLKYDCIDTVSAGGPFLIYTETKVTAGQQRKLPVLNAVIEMVREQQAQIRRRYPDTPAEDLRLFPRVMMNPRGYHPLGSSTFGATLRKWVNGLPRVDSAEIGEDGNPLPFDRGLITAYSFRHTYAQRHADAGVAPDVLKELMGHENIANTMGYYRIPQKRRRQAAELVGNLVITGEHLTIAPMTPHQRLANERATIAVPFGKCSNPQNVAAEGHGCPIRHRCFGCASFSSDPSYLPEMRRRLLDLKAIRARVDAFEDAAEWAKRDARPSDEEIDALQQRIRVEQDKLAHATPEQRALIEEASITLRKARASAQVDLTLRRVNGQDALAHSDDRRHVVDALGTIIDE